MSRKSFARRRQMEESTARGETHFAATQADGGALPKESPGPSNGRDLQLRAFTKAKNAVNPRGE